MAPLVLFPNGIQASDAARARREQAAELKAKLLSATFTNEMYGPASVDEWSVKPTDLMENPDELSSRWGYQDIDKVCGDMAGNVLPYGALVEGRKDVGMGLKLSWLPGIKGDAESEAARDAVQAAYEAIPERHTVERELCNMAERGFSAAENIFGQQSTGAAKGITTIVQMYNRPMSWYGFDRNHRPYFKRDGPSRLDPERVDDYKVTYGRQGSLHTRYGSGYAQRCYPTVFAIDKLMKQHMAAVERASWVPVIVLHPSTWSKERRLIEHATLRRQWPNILLVPAEVDKVEIKIETGGTYAASNATGTSRMEIISYLVTALAMFVRGSQSTSGSQTGSFAKEQTLDNAQMWKAPTDAAAREAMWNRSLVEPTMLANFPAMDRAKWPRCSIEAGFGEDVAQFIDACERGVKMGVPISQVTYSERTGIPLADLTSGEPILEAAQAPSIAPIMPDGLPADELEDPVTGIVKRLSEPHSIRVQLADGSVAQLRPSQPVWIEGKGIMRATELTGGGQHKLVSAGRAKFRRAT